MSEFIEIACPREVTPSGGIGKKMCNAFALFSVRLIFQPTYGWVHPCVHFCFHWFWLILFFYVNSPKTRLPVAVCRQPGCTRGAPLSCATHCTVLLLVDVSTGVWMGHPCTDDNVTFYFFPFVLFWLAIPAHGPVGETSI